MVQFYLPVDVSALNGGRIYNGPINFGVAEPIWSAAFFYLNFQEFGGYGRIIHMNNLAKKDLKVALVHDFLVNFGGAERVLEVLAEIYPEAPIYTLIYDKEKMRGKFKEKVVFASFLQKFPKWMKRNPKWLLPLMPTAPETFDLRDFDLVISSSGAWSKGIVTRLNTMHVSYLHSPMRFAWDMNEEYLREKERSGLIKIFSRIFLNYIRVWDKLAADRPDHLIANSIYTKKRISKYYNKECKVIYPPVDLEHEKINTDKKGHFLIVSRLSKYKKIEEVVGAFNKLGLPLVVIGEGEEKKNLEKIAGENVQILGWKTEKEIANYYAGARAFLFPGVDDFGIAPVEAMSYGVPVLAIREGGVREIVKEGITGEFFDAATPEVIADCVRRFMEKENGYDRQVIISEARKFSKDRFVREFKEYIENI